MIYLQLPDNSQRKLPFYLAMEEYAATLPLLDGNDLFFMWRVKPTVIYGRCQIGSREVDLNYCRKNNIEVYRRKSGGGCVYADEDNIMLSYITRQSNSTSAIFNNYTLKIAEFLQTFNVSACASSRNDITINGRKVSGNAFYNCKGTSIVHGTMLYNTDITHMLNALTPSRTKIESKGIASVESRITTLNKYIDFTIERFMQMTKDYLCDSSYALTENDIKSIEKLSEPYYTDQWRYGLDLKTGSLINKRIDGVGDFFLNISISDNNLIKNIDIAGDFFILGDISEHLVNPLIGVEYSRKYVADALKNISVSEIIPGLSNDEYINLIMDSNHE